MLGTCVALILLANAAPTDSVVLTETVQRGEIVSAAILEGEDLSPFIGMEARRTIQAGMALRASDVRAPRIVKRQSAVTVIFERQDLRLSIPGRALGDASEGELVSVLISGRQRPVYAIAMAPGTVRIGSIQ